MSDGVAESERDHRHNTTKKKSATDDFAHSIARIAVAQVCGSLGFQGFQQSALNALADVAVRYIYQLGKTAVLYANLAGRNECNVFDIIQGLEDMGSQQGFSGASDINRCVAVSGIVQEILQYVNDAEEIPFAHSIPRLPIVKPLKQISSFMEIGEMPPAEHVPAWLPAFPGPMTCVDLPLQHERKVDAQSDKIVEVIEHNKVEQSLMNLQQELGSDGFEASPGIDPVDAAKTKRAADSNPFLAAPMQFGEKEVSSLVLPPKLLDEARGQNPTAVRDNHVSELDTIESAVESRACDAVEGKKQDLLNKRATVKFKFGTSKKSFMTALSFGNVGNEKTGSWFGNETEKDEKKRRVEQIIMESMESSQELT